MFTFSGMWTVTNDRLNTRKGFRAIAIFSSLQDILKREPMSYSSFFLSAVNARASKNSKSKMILFTLIKQSIIVVKWKLSVVDTLRHGPARGFEAVPILSCSLIILSSPVVNQLVLARAQSLNLLLLLTVVSQVKTLFKPPYAFYSFLHAARIREQLEARLGIVRSHIGLLRRLLLSFFSCFFSPLFRLGLTVL